MKYRTDHNDSDSQTGGALFIGPLDRRSRRIEAFLHLVSEIHLACCPNNAGDAQERTFAEGVQLKLTALLREGSKDERPDAEIQ